MASADDVGSGLRRRRLLSWLLGGLLVALYLWLPDAERASDELSSRDDTGDELDRIEITHVSPPDPYPGSSIRIRYEGAPEDVPLRAYATGKRELDVLAQRPFELVARLPRELEAGDLKLKIAAGDLNDDLPRQLRSKAYHVRVKAPDLRKAFRNFVGGMALIVLGIGLMARGVRESTGLDAARAVTRAARVRSIAYGFGAITGALVQSTTSAAGVLAALSTSGVLPLAPAALAFLGAQCGAAVAPLLVTGLLAPREGLIAVAIGMLWLNLAIDRRAAALGRLVLGVGFVAFGLQVLRPAFEPFVSDPVLMGLADNLRADNALDVALCALIGSALVALFQGPAPLIVLILAVAQTTGRWDLTTALALLAGTGFGAATAALLTASAGTRARRLAHLHLWLGAASTLFAACTVRLWSGLAERLLDLDVSLPGAPPGVPLHELGAPLALSFGASQLTAAALLALLVPRLAERLLQRELASATLKKASRPELAASAREGALRTGLVHALERQEVALDALAVLAQTGARSFGRKAEHALSEARATLSRLVKGDLLEAELSPVENGIDGGAAFACLQLQHALESLLSRAERGTEARLSEAHAPELATPWDDQLVLRELHELVAEGLSVTRTSLLARESPDLDQARAREIKINRLESHARRMPRESGSSPQLIEQHVHMLQVIDAYEVVGNQVYRLTEAINQNSVVPV